MSTPPIAALALGDGKVWIKIGAHNRRQLPLLRRLDAETLAAALENRMHVSTMFSQVVIIGTKTDGTAGWNGVDSDELATLITKPLRVMTEAEALHLSGRVEGQRAGYIIFGTCGDVGYVRWYVEAADGALHNVPMTAFGNNKPLFAVHGDSIIRTPSLVASIIDAMLQEHPKVAHIYFWSADGIPLEKYGANTCFWRMILTPVDAREIHRLHLADTPLDSVCAALT